jgi:hypothetical protein
MRNHFDLKLTDRAEQERSSDVRPENLDRALLAELRKTGA